MDWVEEVLSRLELEPVCGYTTAAPTATEPSALSALALFGHGRFEAARRAMRWLDQQQNADGSVGICEGQSSPNWPTALVMLAWLAEQQVVREDQIQQRLQRAFRWSVSLRGETVADAPELGHDTTLQAWPWVAGTHSWIEPTSLHVLALKAFGQRQHVRVREAVRLLIDRQLPHGGCNYGNTLVLGQELRPHVQPSGMSLLALAGELDPRGRISRSLLYLRKAITSRTTPVSLAWSLLGLAAHGVLHPQREQYLQDAVQRVLTRDRSHYKLALLALAALEERSPLIRLTRPPVTVRPSGE